MDQQEEEAIARLSHNRSLHIGPFLIAGLLDCLFCGFLLIQWGRYLSSKYKDPVALKLAVTYVMLMNIAGSLLTSVWVYDLFVYHFGTYRMFISNKYISWFFIINSSTVVVVQAFFGWRAWRLMKRNMFVAGAIIILVLGALGGGIGIKVACSTHGSTINPQIVRVPAYICMSCTVAADSMITCIILYYIYKNRKKGSIRTTQVLGRVARITFESQLPPTAAACALSLTYLANENGFLIIPILVVKLKSYGISFLHTLNSREPWKQPESTIANQTYKLNTHPTQWATGTVSSNALSAGSLDPQDVVMEVSVMRVIAGEEKDVCIPANSDISRLVEKDKPGVDRFV